MCDMDMCMCVSVCMYVHVCACMCTCMYACAHTYRYNVCVHVCCVYTTHVFACMCVDNVHIQKPEDGARCLVTFHLSPLRQDLPLNLEVAILPLADILAASESQKPFCLFTPPCTGLQAHMGHTWLFTLLRV